MGNARTMQSFVSHSYIALTVVLTVYSQLVIRWQVGRMGPLPRFPTERLWFVVCLLLKPWVLSALIATFLAGISWMLAMTKFELSYASPFVSLTFILVLIGGILFFGETFGLGKLIGTLLIIAGIVVVSKYS